MYKPEIISNAEYHGRKTHLSSTNIRTFKKNRKQFEYSLSHDLVKQTKAMDRWYCCSCILFRKR